MNVVNSLQFSNNKILFAAMFNKPTSCPQNKDTYFDSQNVFLFKIPLNQLLFATEMKNVILQVRTNILIIV
jgi:hypothetical protein